MSKKSPHDIMPCGLTRAEHDAARLERWRHYSFLGHVSMAKANLTAMLSAPTTTDETQHLAHQALVILDQLQSSLATRRPPNG